MDGRTDGRVPQAEVFMGSGSAEPDLEELNYCLVDDALQIVLTVVQLH